MLFGALLAWPRLLSFQSKPRKTRVSTSYIFVSEPTSSHVWIRTIVVQESICRHVQDGHKAPEADQTTFEANQRHVVLMLRIWGAMTPNHQWCPLKLQQLLAHPQRTWPIQDLWWFRRSQNDRTDHDCCSHTESGAAKVSDVVRKNVKAAQPDEVVAQCQAEWWLHCRVIYLCMLYKWIIEK